MAAGAHVAAAVDGMKGRGSQVGRISDVVEPRSSNQVWPVLWGQVAPRHWGRHRPTGGLGGEERPGCPLLSGRAVSVRSGAAAFGRRDAYADGG
jgi:hypothetical protein